MKRIRVVLLIGLAAAVFGCEPPERPMSWDVPAGTTRRQANQDALTCKQLTGPPAGAALVLSGFELLELSEHARSAYIECMERVGYTLR